MDDALGFWVGSWTCTWDGGHGTNEVTRELGERVIVERFEALEPEPFSGMSVSILDRDGAWRQTWVDASGNHWNFVGRITRDTVTFATPARVDEEQVFKRMVFSNIEEDGFDWRWESSADGAAWDELWALRYARR